MSFLQLLLTGIACLGFALAVVIEVRRARKEDRLWRHILNNQELLEPDLY